jgi:hypothetical protein
VYDAFQGDPTNDVLLPAGRLYIKRLVYGYSNYQKPKQLSLLPESLRPKVL